MATINLGAIKFNWKGAYNSSTSYAVDDVVSSGGNSYVCIQAHSNQAVGNATAYWNIMSSAGTNGSNGSTGAEGGTTTLTTRGDILYRGASNVARLPKGTQGYVLKQGANDPEWGEAAGGALVKLVSTKVTGSSVANITFNSSILDTSTYKKFKFYIHLYSVNANPANVFAYPSIDNGSNYNLIAFSAANAAYVKFDGSNDGDYRGNMHYANNSSWKLAGAVEGSNTTNQTGQWVGEAILFNTNETSTYSNSAHFLWQGGRYHNNGSNNEHVMVVTGHGMACRMSTGQAVNNLQFSFGSGNIQVDSRITVYGVKET